MGQLRGVWRESQGKFRGSLGNRHMRVGAVMGSLEKVAVLTVRVWRRQPPFTRRGVCQVAL